VAGVTSDIDPVVQAEWVALTRPGTNRLAVLYSARTRRTAEAIRRAGSARRLEVQLISADRDAFPQAIDALNRSDCDGVLMIPDAGVYNSPNVQRLLLWGARRNTPIWAFSANVLKAGAYSGLYCDSRSVGLQAARIVRQVAQGTPPDRIGVEYPRAIERAINLHTAEMIGARPDRQTLPSDTQYMGARE
jgi:ABC-type uncharacterized transport system substrate-binding protein